MDAAYALILETARLGPGGECRFEQAAAGGWICDLQLEDQSFLVVRPEDSPDQIVLYADFGEIPQARAAEHMRRILEINLALADSGRAGFGLDAETGHLIYALPVPGAQASPRSLRLALENVAAQARSWRQDCLCAATVSDVPQLDPGSLA